MTDINRRIDELKGLKAGWLNGDGEPLDPDGVEWARSIIAVMQFGVSTIGLYPTVRGNLQLEADDEDVDISICFDLKARTILVEGTYVG